MYTEPTPAEYRATHAATVAALPYSEPADLAKGRAQRAYRAARKAIKVGDLAKAQTLKERADLAAAAAERHYNAAYSAARAAYLAHGGQADPDKRAAIATYYIEQSKTRAQSAAWNLSVIIIDAKGITTP